MYLGARASFGKRNSGFWNPSCEHGLSWTFYPVCGEEEEQEEKSRKEPHVTGPHIEAWDERGARSSVKGSRFPLSAVRTCIIHSPLKMPRVLHQYHFPPLLCVSVCCNKSTRTQESATLQWEELGTSHLPVFSMFDRSVYLQKLRLK